MYYTTSHRCNKVLVVLSNSLPKKQILKFALCLFLSRTRRIALLPLLGRIMAPMALPVERRRAYAAITEDTISMAVRPAVLCALAVALSSSATLAQKAALPKVCFCPNWRYSNFNCSAACCGLPRPIECKTPPTPNPPT